MIRVKRLQKKTSISMLMITFWQMVIGVIAAWLQLGERPTPIEAAGMALIGAALAMLAWNPLEFGRGG